VRRYGSYWRSWAVHRSAEKRFIVTHLPSGCRVTEFDSMRIARRFCEAIDELADWAELPPPDDRAAISLQMHFIALRLSGATPALHVVGGGDHR